MKPPPRKRAKVERNLVVESVSGSYLSKWQQPEKRKLLKALNRLSQADGGNVDIDYSFLKTCIVTRSMSEVGWCVQEIFVKSTRSDKCCSDIYDICFYLYYFAIVVLIFIEIGLKY